MKQRLLRLRQYPVIRSVLLFVYMFFYEYVSNHIVAKIPCERLRFFYYRYVLRHSIDKSAYIYMNVYIYPTIYHSVQIGKYTAINRSCVLDGRGGLIIGNNVNISAEVAIYTEGHQINSPGFDHYSKQVIVSDYVWIGTRAMIMPGVTIGKGAVIMPGAVVVKNVAPFSVVGGVPATKIGERTTALEYNLTYRAAFL